VASLERKALNGSSMAKAELDYATKMVELSLSNFSAWHNPTQLILTILDEKAATDERRQMPDNGKLLDCTGHLGNAAHLELELIHSALLDPYDQSLRFYHQNLMCAFDPDVAKRSMAPNLGQC
jgi:geranylgeranyl transferase type-2 subunit alpha